MPLVVSGSKIIAEVMHKNRFTYPDKIFCAYTETSYVVLVKIDRLKDPMVFSPSQMCDYGNSEFLYQLERALHTHNTISALKREVEDILRRFLKQ